MIRNDSRWFPGPVLLLLLAVATSGRADSGGSLDADRRRSLIETVREKLAEIYPFEEIAERTRAGLLAHLESGRYETVTSPAAFASRVSADMEELSRDRHLDLIYDPELAAELLALARKEVPTGELPASEVEHARWENFGFRELRFLDGGVGYLDLRFFFAARHGGATAVAAMNFLAEAKAVIIDLRRNGGGWDDMVTLLAGYFASPEEPETLAILQSTLDDGYFASVVPAFVPGRKLTDRPVYLLLSRNTASAAEAFAGILDHLNEEVILVGEATAGAENPVERIPLDEEWVLKIPCFRKLYFGGRSGWEGRGLTPELEVEAERALETAHRHALRALAERHPDGIGAAQLQWGIDGYRALLEPPDLPSSLLESFAGRYRGAEIILEGEDLLLRFDDGPKRRLLPVSRDYFAVESRDDMRIRMLFEEGKVTGFERTYSDGWSAVHARE